MCIAWQCGGVTEIKGKFYINKGYGVTSGASGTKIYQKSGTVIVEQTITVAFGYVHIRESGAMKQSETPLKLIENISETFLRYH
jgi:hypothetical protein